MLQDDDNTPLDDLEFDMDFTSSTFLGSPLAVEGKDDVKANRASIGVAKEVDSPEEEESLILSPAAVATATEMEAVLMELQKLQTAAKEREMKLCAVRGCKAELEAQLMTASAELLLAQQKHAAADMAILDAKVTMHTVTTQLALKRRKLLRVQDHVKVLKARKERCEAQQMPLQQRQEAVVRSLTVSTCHDSESEPVNGPSPAHPVVAAYVRTLRSALWIPPRPAHPLLLEARKVIQAILLQQTELKRAADSSVTQAADSVVGAVGAAVLARHPLPAVERAVLRELVVDVAKETRCAS